MLSPTEILEYVREKDTNTNIGRVLGLPPPRITELYKGARQLSAEEAKKLIDHYKIDQSPTASLASCRLLALHCARQWGMQRDGERIELLAQDINAFIKFASASDVDSAQAEAFLAGMSAAQKRK